MTPKEKAVEVVNKYLSIEDSQAKMGGNLMFKSEAIKCTLIAIDEILSVLNENDIEGFSQDLIYHWQKVKIEITKL